jgi:PAS domain S-box-containing protein
MIPGVLKNIREFLTAYLVVLAGTVVIVSGSVYVLHVGNRITSQYVPLAEAAMEIRLDVTDAHLWLEEILGGDTNEDIQVVWSALECAQRHVDAILEGGEDEEWLYIPIDSPAIRSQAEVVKKRLDGVILLTHKRLQAKELAKTGTEIDQEYDLLFRGFAKDAYQLERQLRGLIKSDTVVFKNMQVGFIVGAILVALAVLLTLYKYMKQRKDSEDVIRKSEAKYRALVSNIPGAVYRATADADWTMRYISGEIEKICGYPPSDFVGNSVRTFASLIHLDDKEAVNAEVFESLSKEQAYQLHYRILAADGEIRFIFERGQGVFDEDGKLQFLEGVFFDVSEHRIIEDALHLSEEQNRMTLDNMISGYALHEMMYDDEGKAVDYRFLDANPAFKKLVGMDPRGKTVREIIPDIDDLWINTFAEITSSGVGKRFEQYQAEVGKWWEVAGFRVKPGQFASIFNDITKRKKAEGELEKLLNSLQAKNKELESIVYTISHDLRSPLVNVTGYCNELKRSYGKIERMILAEQLPDELRAKCKSELAGDSLESLEYIINSAMKMDVLLAGLLTVCRLGRQEPEIKRLDMNKLIDDVVSGMHYQITEKSIDVKRDDLPECMGDKAQLNQVFSNLIDNSIKYMSPERACKINISAEVKEDSVVYCVQDNGIGVHEDYRERVFEIFHRLDPLGEIAGEGLGLTIIRRILDMHGGESWFESEEGKGSRFYISIPKK